MSSRYQTDISSYETYITTIHAASALNERWMWYSNRCMYAATVKNWIAFNFWYAASHGDWPLRYCVVALSHPVYRSHYICIINITIKSDESRMNVEVLHRCTAAKYGGMRATIIQFQTPK